MKPLALTSEFSVANARACLEACGYVYDNECSIVTELAHAAILETSNANVLAFRGSRSARDWLTDFDCDMDAAPRYGGRVHCGFLAAIESVREELVRRAVMLRGPLFVTGHSLGGAMAVLAALVLERAGLPIAAVYTFGGPRVGDAKWAGFYGRVASLVSLAGDAPELGGRTWRVVNEEDIVPRVPGVLMGYRHVGTEVFLPSTGGLTVKPSVWSKLKSDLVGTWQDCRHGRVAQLTDHHLAAYASRLEEVASNVTEGVMA